MRRILALVVAVAFASIGVAAADTLKKGNNEVIFAFSYDDVSPDVGDNVRQWAFDGRWGYLLTDAHEAGVEFIYGKIDTAVGDVDQLQYGIFYNYNFTAGDIVNPYVGAQVDGFGGDLGDQYDWSYGVQGGVKVYPWTNGGFNFGMRYDWWTAAEDDNDATNFRILAGVLLKW